jgi:hypothetical protein
MGLSVYNNTVKEQEDIDAKASIDPQVIESRENCGICDCRVMNMVCVKPIQRDHNRTNLGLVCSCMFTLLVHPLNYKLRFQHHGFGCKVNTLGRALLRLASKTCVSPVFLYVQTFFIPKCHHNFSSDSLEQEYSLGQLLGTMCDTQTFRA